MAACARRASAVLACVRRGLGADAAAPRGARLLSAEAKAGEPDAAKAAEAAQFLTSAKLKAHADKFKTLDEVLTKKRRELKEAGLTPKEVRSRGLKSAHGGSVRCAALTLGARCDALRPARSASGSCATRSSTARASSSRESARVQRSCVANGLACASVALPAGSAWPGEQALRSTSRGAVVLPRRPSLCAAPRATSSSGAVCATRLPHPCGVSPQALCVCALSSPARRVAQPQQLRRARADAARLHARAALWRGKRCSSAAPAQRGGGVRRRQAAP